MATHAREQHHTDADAASDKLPESLSHTKDEEDVVSANSGNEAESRGAFGGDVEKPSPAPASPGPVPVCLLEAFFASSKLVINKC